jgi:hypothetical protein
MDEAMLCVTRPHDLKLLIQTEGRLRTTMEDVMVHQDGPPREESGPASPYHRAPELVP